jgi:hypothetical protein
MDLFTIDIHALNLLAQATDTYGEADASGAVSVVGGLFGLVLGLLGYIFGAFCFQKIFQRLNQPNDWFAWVPILNNWAMLKAGDVSPWWVVALFVPIVNFVGIVFMVIALVNIVKKLGKSPWLLVLLFVPIANFWLLYHLAFQ